MKKKSFLFIVISLALTIGIGIVSSFTFDDTNILDISSIIGNETYEKDNEQNAEFFQDDDTLYENSDEVKVLYITVGASNNADCTNHTWNEVYTTELNWYEENNVEQYECESVVQFGNEDGPVSTEYGYEAVTYNSTIKLSGEKSSEKPQKNLRINIKDGFGSVDGIKSFTLSKSFSDPYRFTNKLCFSLLEDIPGQLSVRNSFVHVYIKDVTESTDTKFVDYGLFTMVENVNKRYLKNRGLDNSGEFYKINSFDWERHEDVIVQPTDYRYDEKEFDKYLESKGRKDNSNLLSLLIDVNDYSLSIEDIVERYFDETNLYYWMAFNILVDNTDIGNENYYIYNPIGTEKFYFISWDLDGALRNDYLTVKKPDESEGWNQGALIFDNSVLFRRILQSQYCVNKLSEAVDDLHENLLNSENVSNKAKEMAEVAKDYIYSYPDKMYARVTGTEYDELVEAIAEQMNNNYYTYYDSIESPWAVYVYVNQNDEGHVIVSWDEAFALNMDVSYTLYVSDSWEFTNVLVHEEGLKERSFDLGEYGKGQYFVKLISVSSNGNTQISKEIYNTELKTSERGVMCFYVIDDGSVEKTVFED